MAGQGMSTDTTKKKLYRNKRDGKFAGVCAGVADYLNIEAWVVRIALITGLVFSTGFFLVVYVALWLILDENPEKKVGAGLHQPITVKTKVYQAGEPPRQAFADVRQEFAYLEGQLQRMERYVTSSEYQLKREISKL